MYFRLQKFSDRINWVTQKIVVIILMVMAVDVFLNVMFRYLFKIAFISSEELARYLMIWAAFLGLSLAAKGKEHIGLEYFRKLAGPRLNLYLIITSDFLTMFFFGILFYYSLKFAALGLNNLTPAMRISYFVVYFSIPLGCFLTVIQILFIFLNNLNSLLRP
jgi:TRAP-type C4-dicarboxylate transport system permease small subunit